METTIFEMLGIPHREDSFTDLIVYAFKNCDDFKNRFIQYFIGKINEKCSSHEMKIAEHSEYGLAIRKSFNGTEGKNTPDLILYSMNIESLNFILIIEMKVFSSEGFKQTQRYWADRKNILTIPEIAKTSRLNNLKFFGFYVSLFGNTPSSDDFIIIDYPELINSCCNGLKCTDKALKILLDQFSEIAAEFINTFKNIEENKTTYTELLIDNNRWVREDYIIKYLLNHGFVDLDKVPYYESYNAGKGHLEFIRTDIHTGKMKLESLKPSDWIKASDNYNLTLIIDWGKEELTFRINWEAKSRIIEFHEIRIATDYLSTKKLKEMNKVFFENYSSCKLNSKGALNDVVKDRGYEFCDQKENMLKMVKKNVNIQGKTISEVNIIVQENLLLLDEIAHEYEKYIQRF